MDILKKNIINIYGDRGKCWIENLPDIINKLANTWELNHIVPVDNMTFNYVARAIKNNKPVILKISCDEKSILDETRALQYFNGSGSIHLISYQSTYHALLLQQAVPGITLKSLYPFQMEYVMDCYIETMKKLHSKHLDNKANYRHISDWLSAIDNLSEHVCSTHLIKKAIALKNALLGSMIKEIFLHGDLHHDNILKHDDHWVAIDPKGIVGEPEFEMAAFDFMYISELANKVDVKNIFQSRIHLLAQKANLNSERMKDWVFVRLMLMVAWHVEDNGDPRLAIKLAELLV